MNNTQNELDVICSSANYGKIKPKKLNSYVRLKYIVPKKINIFLSSKLKGVKNMNDIKQFRNEIYDGVTKQGL